MNKLQKLAYGRLEALRAWFLATFTEAKSKAEKLAVVLRAAAAAAIVSSVIAAYHAFAERTLSVAGIRARPGVSGVIAVFVVVLIAGILLMVGALVEAFVFNQLPTAGLSSSQIANIDTINGDVVSALALLGVGLIALGAGGVISALLGAFNFGTK